MIAIFQENIFSTSKHIKSPLYCMKTAISSARQAALSLKKKAISLRKTRTLEEIPSTPSSSRHDVSIQCQCAC